MEKPGQISMSRKAWESHKRKVRHFNTPENFLDTINDPDYVLLQKKEFGGHSVFFLIKDYYDETAVTIVFTNLDGNHKIATGYYISKERLENYLNKHTIIWQS